MPCESSAGAKHSRRRVSFYPHYSQEVDFVLFQGVFPEGKSEQWQSPGLEAKKRNVVVINSVQFPYISLLIQSI